MHYTKLLEVQIYYLRCKFILNNHLLINQPWGEVDWQSGIERWKMSCNVFFEGVHNIDTSVPDVPILEFYVDKSSIEFKEKNIDFYALGFFSYSSYFTDKKCIVEDFGNYGIFLDANWNRMGDFEIIRQADPVELITWINESPY